MSPYSPKSNSLFAFKSDPTNSGGLEESSVKELPIELLIEIFLYCLPSDGFPKPSSDEAPILLGRVCSVWRSVALTTPQFWAQISLTSSPNLDVWNSEEFREVGMLEWIHRSGNRPLSFEIGEHIHQDDLERCFTLTLREEAHRWEAVRSRATCHCVKHMFEVLSIPGETPMLTDVRLISKHSLSTNLSIACAPQLRTIHCHGSYSMVSGAARLYDLRELRISNQSGLPQSFYTLLSCCSLLEILEITCPTQFPLNRTQTEVYTLRHLHTLILDGHNEHLHAPLRLLNSLDTPVLNSLAVTNCGDSTQPSTIDLSNFLMRCGSRLQRLKVSGDSLSCGDLVEYLRHTPLLKSLSVESVMLRKNSSTICPLLVHFDILVTQTVVLDKTLSAVDTVLKRWRRSKSKGSTIMSPATIRVPVNHLSAVLNLPGIRECIEQGLRVEQLGVEKGNWWASQVPPPPRREYSQYASLEDASSN